MRPRSYLCGGTLGLHPTTHPMPAIVTDEQTIAKLVGEAVEAAVSARLPDLVREAVWKPYLSQQEVRDLTGFSNRKLSYLRKTRQVEYTELGRTYLYSTRSLLRFLEEKRVRLRGDVPVWGNEPSR